MADIVANPLADGWSSRQSMGVSSFSGRTRRLYPSCERPTLEWTWFQIFWVVLHTVATSAVVFGINFGLCLLSFTGKEVTLFQFPIPMTGTYAIAICGTTIGNWYIGGTLMSLDVLYGRISPIHPQCVRYWPNSDSFLNKYTIISEFACPSDAKISICRRIYQHGKKVLPWLGLLYTVLFPVLIVISYFVWGDHGYRIFNLQPELITGAIAVLSVWMTVPIWAIFALANIGERYITENSEASIVC